MITIRNCKVCNKPFEAKAHNARYCLNCRSEAYHKLMRDYGKTQYYPCPQCGHLITPRSKLCRSCRGKELSIRYKGLTVHRDKPRKQLYRTGSGYILQYQPNHPNCNHIGYILQHRLVMEGVLRRYLGRDEIVHHLNAVRDDNRSQNLAVVKVHNHSTHTYVKALQKRIRNLEAQLAQHLLPLQS